jgi:anthranilate/para-aminobenzoate synthase component I
MTCDCDQSDEEYGAVVRNAARDSRREIFQVVPSRRFSLPCPSPLAAYDVLKRATPARTCSLCRTTISVWRLAGKLAEIRRRQPPD